MSKLTAEQIERRLKDNPVNTVLNDETPEAAFEYRVSRKFIPEGLDLSVIPRSFDGRKVWGKLLTPPGNQGKCGSCWAFASASCLSDKFNITSEGEMYIELSPAEMILCGVKDDEINTLGENSIENIEYNNHGINIYNNDDEDILERENIKSLKKGACYGDTLIRAWDFLYTVGTTTLQCIPYNTDSIITGNNTSDIGLNNTFSTQTSNNTNSSNIDSYTFSVRHSKPINLTNFSNIDELPLCSEISGPYLDMCTDFKYDKFTGVESGTPKRTYRCKNYWITPGTPETGGNIDYIMYNIYRWGPVSSAFRVYKDFYTFDAKNDVYVWDGKSPYIGGHAIEIVGWGEQRISDSLKEERIGRISDSHTDGRNNNNSLNGREIIPYWIIKNFWGTSWGDGGYFKFLRGENHCGIEINVVEGSPDFFYPPTYNPDFNVKNSVTAGGQDRQKRLFLDNYIHILGGGIDPKTGYSRRVLNRMPWLSRDTLFIKERADDWFAGKIKIPEKYKITKDLRENINIKENTNKNIKDNTNKNLNIKNDNFIKKILLFFIIFIFLIIYIILIKNYHTEL